MLKTLKNFLKGENQKMFKTFIKANYNINKTKINFVFGEAQTCKTQKIARLIYEEAHLNKKRCVYISLTNKVLSNVKTYVLKNLNNELIYREESFGAKTKIFLEDSASTNLYTYNDVYHNCSYMTAFKACTIIFEHNFYSSRAENFNPYFNDRPTFAQLADTFVNRRDIYANAPQFFAKDSYERLNVDIVFIDEAFLFNPGYILTIVDTFARLGVEKIYIAGDPRQITRAMDVPVLLDYYISRMAEPLEFFNMLIKESPDFIPMLGSWVISDLNSLTSNFCHLDNCSFSLTLLEHPRAPRYTEILQDIESNGLSNYYVEDEAFCAHYNNPLYSIDDVEKFSRLRPWLNYQKIVSCTQLRSSLSKGFMNCEALAKYGSPKNVKKVGILLDSDYLGWIVPGTELLALQGEDPIKGKSAFKPGETVTVTNIDDKKIYLKCKHGSTALYISSYQTGKYIDKLFAYAKVLCIESIQGTHLEDILYITHESFTAQKLYTAISRAKKTFKMSILNIGYKKDRLVSLPKAETKFFLKYKKPRADDLIFKASDDLFIKKVAVNQQSRFLSMIGLKPLAKLFKHRKFDEHNNPIPYAYDYADVQPQDVIDALVDSLNDYHDRLFARTAKAFAKKVVDSNNCPIKDASKTSSKWNGIVVDASLPLFDSRVVKIVTKHKVSFVKNPKSYEDLAKLPADFSITRNEPSYTKDYDLYRQTNTSDMEAFIKSVVFFLSKLDLDNYSLYKTLGLILNKSYCSFDAFNYMRKDKKEQPKTFCANLLEEMIHNAFADNNLLETISSLKDSKADIRAAIEKFAPKTKKGTPYDGEEYFLDLLINGALSEGNRYEKQVPALSRFAKNFATNKGNYGGIVLYDFILQALASLNEGTSLVNRFLYFYDHNSTVLKTKEQLRQYQIQNPKTSVLKAEHKADVIANAKKAITDDASSKWSNNLFLTDKIVPQDDPKVFNGAISINCAEQIPYAFKPHLFALVRRLLSISYGGIDPSKYGYQSIFYIYKGTKIPMNVLLYIMANEAQGMRSTVLLEDWLSLVRNGLDDLVSSPNADRITPKAASAKEQLIEALSNNTPKDEDIAYCKGVNEAKPYLAHNLPDSSYKIYSTCARIKQYDASTKTWVWKWEHETIIDDLFVVNNVLVPRFHHIRWSDPNNIMDSQQLHAAISKFNAAKMQIIKDFAKTNPTLAAEAKEYDLQPSMFLENASLSVIDVDGNADVSKYIKEFYEAHNYTGYEIDPNNIGKAHYFCIRTIKPFEIHGSPDDPSKLEFFGGGKRSISSKNKTKHFDKNRRIPYDYELLEIFKKFWHC